jgi:hypothetical protein
MNFEIFINSFPIPFIWKKEIQSSPIENISEKNCVSIKVERSVNKHFKTQKRLNLYTLCSNFEAQRTCLAFHLTFPTSKKYFNLAKECARYGMFGVKGFNVQWWVNENKLGFWA